jgi:23S rRNA (guanine745-N1)-methyltransferase
VAREGHVFLLPTGRKRREAGGPPGDAEAQVRARRAFFDGGFYDPITAAAAAAVLAALPAARRSGSPPPTILDAGCGEGSFIGALATALAAAPSQDAGRPPVPFPTSLLGVDVSKPAVRLAAARHGRVARFAVASSFALPVPPASLDVLLVAMAPLPPDAELGRVLVPGGAAVVVRPAPRHLDGLKRAVYGADARFDDDEDGGGEPEDGGAAPARRPLLARDRLTYSLALPGPAAAALLAMTPFAWSAGEGAVEALAAAGRGGEEEEVALETCVDVWVETWGRPG